MFICSWASDMPYCQTRALSKSVRPPILACDIRKCHEQIFQKSELTELANEIIRFIQNLHQPIKLRLKFSALDIRQKVSSVNIYLLTYLSCDSHIQLTIFSSYDIFILRWVHPNYRTVQIKKKID